MNRALARPASSNSRLPAGRREACKESLLTPLAQKQTALLILRWPRFGFDATIDKTGCDLPISGVLRHKNWAAGK
jgi:hypothetical protein